MNHLKNKKSASEAKALSNKISRENMLLIISMSIAFPFMCFFFSPSEVVLNNQKDLVINANDIILPLFVFSVAVSLAFVLVSVLLAKINKDLFVAIADLVLGFAVASYIQALFFNGYMNDLTGDDLSYESYTVDIINTIIFCETALLPFLINRYNASKKKSEQNDSKSSVDSQDDNLRKYVRPFVFAMMTIMQLAGFCGSYIQNNPKNFEREYNQYAMSYEPTISLSKDGNIVVFLMDRLDSNWIDDLLEGYPELNDELEGFTFYQNNMAHYTNTFPSIAAMLTNFEYNDTEWNEYLYQAWEGENALDLLRENGYNVNLVLDGLTTYHKLSQISHHSDNVITLADNEVILNYDAIIREMSRLSVMRMMPYIIKTTLYGYFNPSVSNQFISDKNDFAPRAVGSESDIKFYDFMRKYGINSDSEKKVFNFIHLNGAHDYSSDIIDLYEGNKNSSVDDAILQTARGDFEIVLEYMHSMKELGVFDNSTFIIVADHGAKPVELDTQDELEHANVAALLIKPANAQLEPLKFNSSATLSNDMFSASVLEYAGIDHSDYGLSYNDVVTSGIECERYFVTFRFNNIGDEKKLHAYKVNGDARDFNNWEKTE